MSALNLSLTYIQFSQKSFSETPDRNEKLGIVLQSCLCYKHIIIDFNVYVCMPL